MLPCPYVIKHMHLFIVYPYPIYYKQNNKIEKITADTQIYAAFKIIIVGCPILGTLILVGAPENIASL